MGVQTVPQGGPMTGIAVRLMGSVEIRDASGLGLDTLPAQSKLFALLAYLVTAQPRSFHRRDKLVALFWPEANQEQARHSLSQALHLLRDELGEAVIMNRGGEDVAIDQAAISCDVVEFETAVDTGEYERALELYRGDFLEGWFIREAPEFARWLDDERTRLREKAAGAAWALAHEHISADRLVDAERTAQRALLLVATDESEVRRFIQALAHAGDRAAAVRFYEKFAHRLRTDYEIEPDPMTVSVATAVANATPFPAQTSNASEQSIAGGPPAHANDGMAPTEARSVQTALTRSKKARIGVAVAPVAILVLAAALLLPRWTGKALDSNRVLVVAFADNSGTEETKALGLMAQEYIIQILTEAGFADVLDPQAAGVAEVATAEGDILGLAHDNGASTLVSGNYYVGGDSVSVQARIIDANDGSVMETVGPVKGSIGTSSVLVGRLAEEVVGRLASLLDHDLEDYEPRPRTARYEAYEEYSEGLDALGGGEGALAAALHFEHALAIDSTFYRAMLWGAAAYLWSGPQYQAKVESWMRKLEESRTQLTRYERSRLDFLTAIAIRPSVSAAYDAAHRMARAAPGFAKAKSEVALLALRSFRPREAIEELRALDPEGNWEPLSMAYHMLGDHERELEAARQALQQFPGNWHAIRAEARALAALGRVDEVKARMPEMLPLGMLPAYVVDELRVHGHPAAARELLDSAIAWRELHGDPWKDLVDHLYRAERWEEAWKLKKEQANASPDDPFIPAFLGVLAARRGDREAALRISDELRSVVYPPLLVSWLTLQRAKIAALLGERRQAMDLLRQGINRSPGWSYPQWPHRDMDFDSLRDYPGFQELMRPKG